MNFYRYKTRLGPMQTGFVCEGHAGIVVFLLQAYPEYLITYQILKPESTAQSAAGAEQKS